MTVYEEATRRATRNSRRALHAPWSLSAVCGSWAELRRESPPVLRPEPAMNSLEDLAVR